EGSASPAALKSEASLAPGLIDRPGQHVSDVRRRLHLPAEARGDLGHVVSGAVIRGVVGGLRGKLGAAELAPAEEALRRRDRKHLQASGDTAGPAATDPEIAEREAAAAADLRDPREQVVGPGIRHDDQYQALPLRARGEAEAEAPDVHED